MKYNALVVLLFTTIVLLGCYVGNTESKYVSGKVKSKDNWVFLTKFCFAYGIGNITYTGYIPQNTSIVIYDDAKTSWQEVYKSKLTCEERISSNITSFTIANGNNHPDYNSTSTSPVKDVQRPHFWYVVAVNCQGSVELDEYSISLTNPGGIWKRQFSYDEQGLEALYLVYFFVFLGLAIFTSYAAYTLTMTRSFHPIVKILTLTIYLEFLSVFILLVHYGVYSHDGVGAKGLQGFGEILDLAAQISFILLLVLIAKGWAISRVTIDDKKIILIVMGLLSGLYLIMFIWIKAGQDHASTVYMYDTAPGIILLVARSLTMIWFMWCGYNTYIEENHPAKRQFYKLFGISFVFWFIALPMICIIASAVDPWVRQRTVLGFYVTFNAVAIAVASFLLSPSRASDYFSISSSEGTHSYENF
ncbi:hypothetical protein CYY_003933 [Polysphondylium violaceum]|uniref:Intimal thickness related receptor IRP domain-containing protein n=1 Tax=Polysphondylium violaceum TaxID=133409 RepID=A0A8J4UZQ7_9MYCE|nr:hypothetical protein CYY_003933 [Polysphondylium violaceum]